MQKMNKKLSELKNDEYVFIEYDGIDGFVEQVSTVLADYEECFKNKEGLKIHTTKPVSACLDANDILANVIENEECDSMYEDWGERIWEDILTEDIQEIQAVLDRILARTPNQNIAHHTDKLVEIDI